MIDGPSERRHSAIRHMLKILKHQEIATEGTAPIVGRFAVGKPRRQIAGNHEAGCSWRISGAHLGDQPLC